MGFWKAVTGRSGPVPARLDALFEVPSAAVILQTETGFTPAGTGSVCYRGAAGAAFAQAQRDIVDLLQSASSAPEVRVSADSFGFTWLTVAGDPGDSSGLCTDLHAVNTTLEDAGFGSGLLCTLVPLPRRERPAARAGLPLQAGHVLRVRADRPAPARQPAGAARPRRARPGAPDGARPPPVARRVGCSGAVTTPEPTADFARRVSHDLKNPLSAIRMSLELAREELGERRRREGAGPARARGAQRRPARGDARRAAGPGDRVGPGRGLTGSVAV